MQRQFDLNIEKILDNWEIYHAVREIISNALDEMIITNTKKVSIYKDIHHFWHIRDYGRGLQYQHLTQNENDEKKKNPLVIGKFGVGLKDALAVLYKYNIHVKILSKYGDITLDMLPKEGFPDTNTLHALISDSSDPRFEGTDFILGVKDEDIAQAKSLFLLFSGRRPLDSNSYGEIYKKSSDMNAAIYVHGVKIAEEPNYLFDYNIVKTNTALEKSLNRERSAVGRTAYSELIKKILLNASDERVVEGLVNQLQEIPKGTNCDEILLNDVQIHAIKIYNAKKRLVFISAIQSIDFTNDDKEKINESERKTVIIPETIFNKIKGEKDYDGNEIATFNTVIREYNERFKYEFIEEQDLTESEKETLKLKDWVFSYYGNRKYINRITISKNINKMLSGDFLGLYDPKEDIIIIKREALRNRAEFCEVLFHELIHATRGYSDNTRAFENEQGKIIRLLIEKQIVNDEEMVDSTSDAADTGTRSNTNNRKKSSALRKWFHKNKKV